MADYNIFITNEFDFDPETTTFLDLKNAFLEAEKAKGVANYKITALKYKGLDLKDAWPLSKIRYKPGLEHIEIYLKKMSMLDML